MVRATRTRLLAQTDRPELTKLVGRIQRQETRHVAFYASQARERLQRSRAAQLLTRLVLKMAGRPWGQGSCQSRRQSFCCAT